MLQIIPLSALIPSTVYAQQTEWINSVKDVNHLEYFMEFSANINNYTSTKYRLDFTTVGSSELRISVNYEDVSLTKGKANFQYQISLESNEINNVNLNFYDLYITSTHTELFIDLENAGTSQTLRVDETVIFADFLKRGHFEGLRKIDTTFQYGGIAVIKNDLIRSFSTYHYSTNYQWESDGVYWESKTHWTILVDYYFDTQTGLLVFEKFHANRYDFADEKGFDPIVEDLYINRTLALVNSVKILANYQDLGPLNPFQNLIWVTLLIIFIPTAAFVIFYIGKSIKRKVQRV